VSTDKQDLDNQKLAILEYARKRDMKVHKFVKMKISSRRSVKDRKKRRLFIYLKLIVRPR
jgi:hypothetical protein